MSNVYIVYSSVDYEISFDPIAVFASEDSATALVEALRTHQANRPIDDNFDYGDGVVWDEYEAALEAWRASAPAKGYEDADYYDARAMELRP